MDRETLAKLTEEEKIDLILSLAMRLAELEAKLKRPKKTSRNSSIPASQEQKANKQKRSKKRGPKKGHPGKSRQRSEPDVILECSVEQCENCGADLSDVPQRVAGRSQVIELPPVKPVVLEAIVYTANCPCCGEEQRSSYPQGFEPERVFGPNIEAMASYLRQVHHLSYSRLKRVFASLFNLSISEGAIDNMLRRVSERVQPAVEGIKEIIRQSAVIGSDETRARVDGFNQWEWVFQTPNASYHTIRDNRRHQAITEFMGDAQTEIWMSDLFSAQLKGARLCAEGQAMCGAHQLRDLQYAMDCGDSLFASPMRQLFLAAKSLAQRRDEFEPDVYERLVTQVNETCDQLLEEDSDTAEGIKMQKRYRRHRQSLFVFLKRPDVPFDNNASERALRNSVIHRKVTGGFRSDAGAEIFANITTIAQTARKNDLPIFQTLQRLLIPSPLTLFPTR